MNSIDNRSMWRRVRRGQRVRATRNNRGRGASRALLFLLCTVIALSLACDLLVAQGRGQEYRSDEHRFRVERVQGNLHHPWSIAVLPDNTLLVSERRGRLWRVAEGERSEIGGLPAIANVGQGGLLDIEIARNFATSRELFFSYSREMAVGSYTTAIGRATLRGNQLSNVTTLFSANNAHSSGIHFGSRISELPDGTLVFSMGDRGRRHDAQAGDLHAGSLLRIDRNGRPPADNPFIGNALFRPELYSIGHRNIQGLAIDAVGAIFAHEHGPRGGDELNRITKGRNYGWPEITYGREYRTNAKIGRGVSAPGYASPLRYWIPSIAPSGMMIYSGKQFPNWRGNIFIGALAAEHIARLVYNNGIIVHEEKLLTREFGRIRDIKEDNNGTIYFITDERNGALYRIIS